MKVKKRNGNFEELKFDKITTRIKKLISEFNLSLDPSEIAKEIINRIYDGIETRMLDIYASQYCISLITSDLEYGELAKIILINNLHKETPGKFSEFIKLWYLENNAKINEDIYKLIIENEDLFNNMIKNKRDYKHDYFGFKTLEKSYLAKNKNGIVIERIQYLFLRTSISIHMNNFKKVKETYDYMSNLYFIHASPTLFNNIYKKPQLSSCFILQPSDSIDGIYKCIKDSAIISKHSGGIGLHISNIRCNGSKIRSTGEKSTGIIPMLKVFNETARHVNQGGKRKGSIAVYLEPWHGDTLDFLNIRKNHGNENMIARDLFTALWIPDLFMERVINNEKWSLMCPVQCKGLDTVYSEEFNKLYINYENKGEFMKQINARDLWFNIIKSQIETGTPYIMFKDNVNRSNMMNNIGIIKGSNLCSEITIYSDENEYAVCNLASIAVNKFYDVNNNEFNYNLLKKIVKIIVQNLNNIIDNNFYPTKECEINNKNNRPIGIGIQGLSDLFFSMKIPFDSIKALKISTKISEVIYYSALEKSMEISKQIGPYKNYQGSIMETDNKFHFELCKQFKNIELTENWEKLRKNIKKFGLRNSLTTAYMPTASTSQILGNFESFEPITNNIFLRKTLSGEFIIINKYLVNDLNKLGLWNNDMKDKIILSNGSIQNIYEIPKDIKQLYKTSWEIKNKNLINMSSQRQLFIDQSQSFNVYCENINYKILSSTYIYGWKMGLKTGCYYLRSKSKAKSQEFTIDPNKKEEILNQLKKECSIKNKEECMMCSS